MDFDELFSSFEEEAFRVECLPAYKVDEEADAIRCFEETGVVPDLLDDGWNEALDLSSQRGKPVRRLRILHEPLTEYERFELAAYEQNIRHGEDIRAITNRFDLRETRDFWVFDMKWIVLLNYDEDGSFVSSETREATPEEIEMAAYWRSVFDEAERL